MYSHKITKQHKYTHDYALPLNLLLLYLNTKFIYIQNSRTRYTYLIVILIQYYNIPSFFGMDLFNTLHPSEAYTCVWLVSVTAPDSSSSPNTSPPDAASVFSRRDIQKNHRLSLLSQPVSWSQHCFSLCFGTNHTRKSHLVLHRSYYNT